MKVMNVRNFPLHFTLQDGKEIHLFPRDSEGMSYVELDEEHLNDPRIKNHLNARNIIIVE